MYSFTGCETEFCYCCRTRWHEGRCSNYEIALTTVQVCPQCRVPIEKSSGCNRISCIICNCKFCWICGKNVTAEQYYHFAGRNGCHLYSSRWWPSTFGVKLIIIMLLWLMLPLLMIFDSVVLTILSPFGITWLVAKHYNCTNEVVSLALIFALSFPVAVVLTPLILITTIVGTVGFVCVFLPIVWICNK